MTERAWELFERKLEENGMDFDMISDSTIRVDLIKSIGIDNVLHIAQIETLWERRVPRVVAAPAVVVPTRSAEDDEEHFGPQFDAGPRTPESSASSQPSEHREPILPYAGPAAATVSVPRASPHGAIGSRSDGGFDPLPPGLGAGLPPPPPRSAASDAPALLPLPVASVGASPFTPLKTPQSAAPRRAGYGVGTLPQPDNLDNRHAHLSADDRWNSSNSGMSSSYGSGDIVAAGGGAAAVAVRAVDKLAAAPPLPVDNAIVAGGNNITDNRHASRVAVSHDNPFAPIPLSPNGSATGDSTSTRMDSITAALSGDNKLPAPPPLPVDNAIMYNSNDNKSNNYSNNNENNNENNARGPELYYCCVCLQSKEASEFTRKQLKKSSATRKCEACVRIALMPDVVLAYGDEALAGGGAASAAPPAAAAPPPEPQLSAAEKRLRKRQEAQQRAQQAEAEAARLRAEQQQEENEEYEEYDEEAAREEEERQRSEYQQRQLQKQQQRKQQLQEPVAARQQVQRPEDSYLSCVECEKSLPPSQFSATQRKKKDEERKCKACVAAADAAALAAEKRRCQDCRRNQSREAYSRPEWAAPDAERRCLECVEKEEKRLLAIEQAKADRQAKAERAAATNRQAAAAARVAAQQQAASRPLAATPPASTSRSSQRHGHNCECCAAAELAADFLANFGSDSAVAEQAAEIVASVPGITPGQVAAIANLVPQIEAMGGSMRLSEPESTTSSSSPAAAASAAPPATRASRATRATAAATADDVVDPDDPDAGQGTRQRDMSTYLD